jgi:hypothetical protein
MAAAGQALLRALRDGTGAGDEPALRRALGLPEDAEDRVVARALVFGVTTAHLEGVALRRGDPPTRDPRAPAPTAPAGAKPADASFLGRLSAAAGSDERTGVFAIADVRTLLAVMQAGSLRLRRAAVRRLVQLVGEHAKGKERAAEDLRAVLPVLTSSRDVEIVYEVSEALAALPGAAGREERAEREAFAAAVSEALAGVHRFWEGEFPEDPMAGVSGEARALLLLRLRDLPDALVDHLCAVLEGADGIGSLDGRRALATALRHAGDPRLVPALGSLLGGVDAPLATEAARALRRIEDPRVLPLLLGAFERTVAEAPRAVLAGALGELGDLSGAAYVRGLLALRDEGALLAVLEALETLGGAEDVAAVVALLSHAEVRGVASAVRTLSCIGDARALPGLEAVRGQPAYYGLRAEVDAAVAAVRARMELRGEEAPAAAVSRDTAAVTAIAARSAEVSDPAAVRFRAGWDVFVGRALLLLWSPMRAIARFEAAAARRPGWVTPLLAIASTYASHREVAQAIAAFRRALAADRAEVERRSLAVRALARCFLLRADELEQAGRTDIARGLLAELGSLDLRLAESAVRFEVGRRHEALRRGGS